jgi:ferredoxin
VNTLNVTIDPDRCVGYGRCAAIAPGVIMIDEDTGKAYYDEDAMQSTPAKVVFGAARACPTQAIIVEQFGRRIYPQILEPMPSEIARRLREAGAGDDEQGR